MDTYIITREQLTAIVNKHPEEYIMLARQIQSQSVSDDEDCILCGAALQKYWHRLTPVLVKALAKAYAVVNEKGKNFFSKNELDLTHSEYGNFQKLRFHALIAKYKTEGEWHKGDWCITRRGFRFLRGEEQVPVRVQTFRNKVVDHDKEMAFVGKIIGSEPYVETDFQRELNEPDQTQLI